MSDNWYTHSSPEDKDKTSCTLKRDNRGVTTEEIRNNTVTESSSVENIKIIKHKKRKNKRSKGIRKIQSDRTPNDPWYIGLLLGILQVVAVSLMNVGDVMKRITGITYMAALAVTKAGKTIKSETRNRKENIEEGIIGYLKKCIQWFVAKIEQLQELRRKGCYMLGAENEVFIEIPCSEATNGKLVLLVDSGADASLIKRSILLPEVRVNDKITKSLRGAFGGYTRTLGEVRIEEESLNGVKLVFHTVGNGTEIPADGILGRDNIWNSSVINARERELVFFDQGNREILKLPLMSVENINQCRTGLSSRIVIPARVRQSVKIRVYTNIEEIIIHKDEVAPGVYIGESLTKVNNGEAFVPILNTTDENFSFPENYAPKFSRYNQFREPKEKFIGNFTSMDVGNRVKTILKTLDLDSNLSNEERASIDKLVTNYQDVFHLEGDKLTFTSVLKHEISVASDQAPINQKQYRLPHAHRDEINRQVDQMLKDDIITHSVSPWNSPLLLVPKKTDKDGNKKWRLVIDFRKVNEATVKQVFPIPRIEEILDQLGHSKYFSTIDLASGYHQVLVDEKAREKTAFSSGYGHYEFKRMPFGLTGAPATFQRIMNSILTGLQGIDCFVYLDDIVVYGKNLKEHERRLCNVLEVLRNNNLKINTGKCQFLRREIIYLGHKCSGNGALPDPSRVECVKNIPKPRNLKEVQTFLGLVNYYRKFISNCAEIQEPINNLKKKGTKFDWDEKCDKAFNDLKDAIINPPVLAYPDFEKPFILTTDASNVAVGAVLSQGEAGNDRPVMFASKALNDAERRYSTIEKELLAIVWATEYFRHYLLHRHFTIYTDHQPLRGNVKLKKQTYRFTKFIHKLSEYDYEIIYKPGKKNQNADALSRLPIPAEDIMRVKTRAMAKEKEQGNLSEGENNGDNQEEAIRTQQRILTDPKDIQTVLRDFHDSVLGGHKGVRKTFLRIKQYYKWPGMKKQITDYVLGCGKCQANKSSKLTKMPMVITDTPIKPFDKVHMDIVGILPTTVSGNRFILTFQDDFSKFMTCAAIPDAEASTVAKVFFEDIITRFNIPKVLVTDNGTNFTSKLFSEVCKMLGVKKVHISPYHPQANGSLERSHRPLAEYLRSFAKEDGSNWDQWLGTAMHVHNNSVHTSTKQTPFRTLYGFEFDMPTNLKKKCSPIYNHDDQSKLLKYQIQRGHEIAKENLEKAKINSKKGYDSYVNPKTFTIGEKVMIKNQVRKNKFSPIWNGPFVVTKIVSKTNTVVKIKNKDKVIHNNLLKVYKEN